ncbi:hypothetical protein [Microvirga sesbaniae]|nr:hypothetical protein [Microvirga sp. HBU67692]
MSRRNGFDDVRDDRVDGRKCVWLVLLHETGGANAVNGYDNREPSL